MGVEHVRLGGMTDTYTYMAEGVVDMEYPRPDPEPIAKLFGHAANTIKSNFMACPNWWANK